MSSFYREMNQERSINRWHDWEGHRNEIKILINKALGSSAKMERAIVLGAGNCDDLDLRFLGNAFNHISLVDIDDFSLKEAVLSIDPHLSRQIQLLDKTDFSKLDQIDFYNLFNRMLQNKASATELCIFLGSIPEKLKECAVLETWKSQYSVVISSAVYTQIFYIHILTMFSGYVSNYCKQEVHRIINEFIKLRDLIVRSYNQLLLSLAKPNGKIIVWSDILKLDEHSPFPEEQFYLLRTEEERIQFLFKLAGQQGREAAVIGFKDLHDKLHPQDRHFGCWVWPFNSSRHYITFGLSGKVNR